MDSYDCPDVMDADLAVDLWFELVEAGFSEEEAFDLVEMVTINKNDSATFASSMVPFGPIIEDSIQ